MSRAETAALHVVDATMFWSPTGGGVRRYLLAKHAALAGRPGLRHTIAVPRTGETGLDGAAADGVADDASAAAADGRSGRATLPSWPLPFSGGYRLPVSRAGCANALQRLAPDVIEAGDPYRVAWAALDAAAAAGAACVAYCHSNLEAMARLAGGRLAAAGARRYARRLYRRFDQVLVPSSAMRRHLAEWGVAGARVQPLGVDTERFHPRRARSDWRRSIGLDDEARVLLYAGRFAAEKNLPLVADAVRRLGGRHVFVAVGAGPLPPPAGSHVRVVPFLRSEDTLAIAMASADAFVHAGDQETYGLSALEAMACGTPLVVRRAEGLAEWVDPALGEPAGLGVERGDAGAFAEAIEALLAGDHAVWARAARRRAEALAWPRLIDDMVANYRALRAGEPRP